MRTIILLISLAAAAVPLAGCSPDSYRASADREVNRILRDRKDAALDYRPKTDLADAIPVDATTPKRAYEIVPLTPIPPAAAVPPLVRPAAAEVPYGPLGPDAKWIGYKPPEQPVDNSTETFGAAATQSFLLGPPSPFTKAQRFDLFHALRYGVEHGRDYQEQLEALYLAALDVTLERHLLSPRPFAGVGVGYTGGQRDVGYRSALTVTGSAGVRQRLPYGGEVVAETLVRFVNAIGGNVDDGESATLALSGSLPLLRGAGLINLEALISQERQLVYQVRRFEDFRRTFAINIARSYFNLLTRQQSVRNREVNLANLAALTERTQALYEAGRVNFLQVQRSSQAFLSAQNLVLTARETYQNALDTFKILLGMPLDEDLAIIPVELGLNVPDLDDELALAQARRYRLDLQTARDQIDDSRRGIDVAKNGLLPDLDLSGRVEGGNRLDTPARELDSQALTYSAGVDLDLPIDRLAERNVYRRSLINFQRAQRDYEDLRDTVESNVRSAVRSIRSAQLTLDIQRESIRLAERRLELSNELLKGGGARAADSRDVVEAQQSLLTAQDSFEQARASLQVQVLQFLRETGTLRIDPESGVIGRALADAGTNDVAADADEPAAQPVPEILPEVRTEQSSAR